MRDLKAFVKHRVLTTAKEQRKRNLFKINMMKRANEVADFVTAMEADLDYKNAEKSGEVTHFLICRLVALFCW
jgi:hypothetical protein